MNTRTATKFEPGAIYPRELEDVPEATMQRILDYVSAVLYRVRRGKYMPRYAFIVADEWAREGFSVITGKRIEREQGCPRRTAWRTLRRLIDDGCIREIGITDEGLPMYEPCLEIGDELRANIGARNAA